MKRNPNTSCNVCQRKIYRRPSQIVSGGVYCSLACTGTSQQQTKTCKICQKSYLGGKQTCSRACANTARAGISYTKNNKRNKAYQGKALKEKAAAACGGMCERCKENNYAILQVHHKKERYRGGTDALSNVELLCPNCHTAHHLGYSLYKPNKML